MGLLTSQTRKLTSGHYLNSSQRNVYFYDKAIISLTFWLYIGKFIISTFKHFFFAGHGLTSMRSFSSSFCCLLSYYIQTWNFAQWFFTGVNIFQLLSRVWKLIAITALFANCFFRIVCLDLFVLTQSGFSLAPVSFMIFLLWYFYLMHTYKRKKILTFDARFAIHFNLCMVICFFVETILLKLWGHRHICNPRNAHSFYRHRCSSVSISLYFLSLSS